MITQAPPYWPKSRKEKTIRNPNSAKARTQMLQKMRRASRIYFRPQTCWLKNTRSWIATAKSSAWLGSQSKVAKIETSLSSTQVRVKSASTPSTRGTITSLIYHAKVRSASAYKIQQANRAKMKMRSDTICKLSIWMKIRSTLKESITSN